MSSKKRNSGKKSERRAVTVRLNKGEGAGKEGGSKKKKSTKKEVRQGKDERLGLSQVEKR